MKKIKCKVCEKRYANQQDWKKGEEREVCLTCRSFCQYVDGVMDSLEVIAKNHGLKFSGEMHITSLTK